MDIINRNPSSDEVFVSPHEPKPYIQHFICSPSLNYSDVRVHFTIYSRSFNHSDIRVHFPVPTMCSRSFNNSRSFNHLGCTSQCPQCVHGVSTTLTLGLPSLLLSANKREADIQNPSPFRYPNRRQLPPLVVNNIKQETDDDEEEESWKIRKTLTTGDLRNTCRFLETKSSLANRLLRYWNYEFVERVLGINKQGCQSYSSRLQDEFKPKIECQVLEELPQLPSQWKVGQVCEEKVEGRW
ncbi:hypothetical protein C1H46_039644 [Malus baccata]|uniref:Uncharacterized protein n=1 Tax=Malus baccata TaxID=106549 RepID=A0A540KKT3_MALBA|nr:hypothetical protein C1H46_039644 [Malus baccata]